MGGVRGGVVWLKTFSGLHRFRSFVDKGIGQVYYELLGRMINIRNNYVKWLDGKLCVGEEEVRNDPFPFTNGDAVKDIND